MSSLIKNLSEYMKKVKCLQTKHEVQPFRLVFRGVYEECGKCYLRPSLQHRENGTLCKYERDMIQEIQRLKPYEFSNLSDLELLGKFQHYKLPTRLLDFSFSPYVALWFAVSDAKHNKDNHQAKVYATLAHPDEGIARAFAKIPQVLTNKYYYYEGQQSKDFYFIEDILFVGLKNEQKENRLKELLLNLFEQNKNGRLVFTYPHFNEKREQNQQSVFAIYMNSIYDTKEKTSILKYNFQNVIKKEKLLGRFVFEPKICNPLERYIEGGKKPNNVFELVIDNNSRDSIKSELEQLGINEIFLFPENLEAASRVVVEYAKNLSRAK